jgi:Forkhead domain
MIDGDQPLPDSPNLPRCDEDDDDSLCDKPYARLIFDALMQAPGHRMMLREIYEWFQRNTTKPKESGTSGWQNSIRHNLSMNQVGINRGLWFGMC